MPLRIITATATSHPPTVPGQPAAVVHGGSTSSSTVPTAMQVTAAVMAMANVRAGLVPPRMVMDVRPSAEDLCRRDIVTASFGDSFHDAYQRMQAADLRAIPVVDAGRRVVGVLSVLHLMELFFNDEGDPLKLRTVTTCLQKIHDVLGGSFQHVLAPEQRDELLVMDGLATQYRSELARQDRGSTASGHASARSR